MHESALTWQEIVENHHSALVDELARRLDSDVRGAVTQAVALERSLIESRVSDARAEARNSQAESLNQALRRLRQTEGEHPVLRVLDEVCAPYTNRAVVLLFENSQARAVASHGLDGGDLSFEITAAPAVVSAIESRDPVVAVATDAELSAELAGRFGAKDGKSPQHAYLYPLKARHSVVAMLIAGGGVAPSASASMPAIELLCEAASMRLETLFPAAAREKPSTPGTDGAGVSNGSSERLSWETLSPDDQQLHLRAQRTARVRVAEMRLYNEKDLRLGEAAGDIYGRLQRVIDGARQQFLQTFLAQSSTMVDYLHLEILRSLAHDDDRLLGPRYPGPMV